MFKESPVLSFLKEPFGSGPYRTLVCGAGAVRPNVGEVDTLTGVGRKHTLFPFT